MKKLTKEQLILLADRLIDDAEKQGNPLYKRDKFTGGAVITAHHYGNISYKADLYFGYGKSKNPIHCKMPISEQVAEHLFSAINEKCKSVQQEKTYDSDLLNDVVTASLRSSDDTVQRKEIDIDKKETAKREEDIILEWVTYLNTSLNKNHSPKAESVRVLVLDLCNDNSLSDLKRVVLSKKREWENTDMRKYLVISTLLRKSKFEMYYGNLPAIVDDPRNVNLSPHEIAPDPYDDYFAEMDK